MSYELDFESETGFRPVPDSEDEAPIREPNDAPLNRFA